MQLCCIFRNSISYTYRNRKNLPSIENLCTSNLHHLTSMVFRVKGTQHCPTGTSVDPVTFSEWSLILDELWNAYRGMKSKLFYFLII